MWLKGLHGPSTKSRFLLLALVIPVVISPGVHLIFPWVDRLAISMQIEEALPILNGLRSWEHLAAPFMVIAFILLSGYNLLAGLAVSLRETRTDAKQGWAVSRREQKIVERLAKRFALPHQPLLIVSRRRPATAYSFGWWRPIITLGSECLSSLKADEIEAILAHELAHFKRGDNWRLLLAKTCRNLMFFNPMAYLVYAEFSEACEQSADDLALLVTHEPLALASGLLKFCRMENMHKVPSGSMGFLRRNNQLGCRILRLVNYCEDQELVVASNTLFYSLAITLAVVLSLI